METIGYLNLIQKNENHFLLWNTKAEMFIWGQIKCYIESKNE